MPRNGKSFCCNDVDLLVADDSFKEYAPLKLWDWSVPKPPTSESAFCSLSKPGQCEPGTDGALPPASKHGGAAAANHVEQMPDSPPADVALPPPALLLTDGSRQYGSPLKSYKAS